MLYLIALCYLIVLIILIHNYLTHKIEGDASTNFTAFLLSPLICFLIALDFIIDKFYKFKKK